MSGDKSVVGFCPMGCGQTLFLGSGGFITCSYVDCSNPSAVSNLLTDKRFIESNPVIADRAWRV